MDFLNFTAKYLALAVVVLAAFPIFLIHGSRRRERVVAHFAGKQADPRTVSTVSPARRRFRQICLFAGLVFVLIALSRPWWGRKLIPYPARSRDVLVVFDCSRSMLADDVAPSRLEHGKWLVERLVERFPGDRFGLVAFAGDAFLECPLTQDQSSFRLVLEDLDTRTIPLGGTNIARALELAANAFKAAAGIDRAVVLITDGDELQGDAMAWTERLREAEIPLLVVGLGSPSQGAMIHDEKGNYVRDPAGNLASTRLDEQKLKQLAAATGGLYIRSTTVDPNLRPLTERIESMVPAEGGEQVKRREIERYQIPAAMAMACFLVFMFTGERRRESAVLGLPVLALAVFAAHAGFAQLDTASAVPEESAAIRDLKEQAEATAGGEKARVLQNLGVAYQQEKMLEKAAEAYRQAIAYGDPDSEVVAAATWNLGVCRHEMARQKLLENPDDTLARLADAEQDYRQALKRAADPKALGRNQELLLRDRQFAERVKERMRELSQMRKEAREQTEKARDAQEQALQETAADEKKRKQNQASQETLAAQEALNKLQQALNQMREDSLRQATPADQAAEAVAQARKLQEEARNPHEADGGDQKNTEKAKQALDKLAEAAELLGDRQDRTADNNSGKTAENPTGTERGQDDDNREDAENAGENPAGTGDLGQGEPDGQPPPQTATPPAAEPGELDADQAAAILGDMQDKERDLREALKENRVRRARLKPAEKDW